MALRVGFGKAFITPPLPAMQSGYYPRRKPADTVHDDLEVRAVVFDDGERALCLVVYDLLGMTEDYSDPIRDCIAAELGVRRAAVVTACNHPHAGPSTLTGSEILGWKVSADYRDLLVERGLAAARDARSAAEPASLHFARGPMPAALLENRRKHPFAPSAAVLDVRGTDGNRVGTIANFGCHPVVLGPKNLSVSTDWIGPFRRAIEDDAGGTAVFLQGCQGDVNPAEAAWDLDDPNDWWPVAERVGGAFAEVVRTLLATTEPVGTEVGVAGERTVAVEVTRTVLAGLAHSGRRRDIELLEWDLGGIRLLTVPGEGMHGLELRVREARGDRVLLAGLAPAWNGYLPVPYSRGYEEVLSFGPLGVEAVTATLAAGPEVEARDVAALGLTRGLRFRPELIDTTRGRIEVARDGNGPTVVIIHGTPGSWRQGVTIAQSLAEDFDVVLPSRPGYGRTPLRAGRSVAEQAAVLEALLDACGIERAAIVGVSGGAPSAAAFAQQVPERCFALVLCCPLAPHLPIDVPGHLRALARVPVLREVFAAGDRWRSRLRIRRGELDPGVRGELTHDEVRRLAEDPKLSEDLVLFEYSHLDAPAAMAAMANDLHNVDVARREGSAPLGRIKAPTLVLHGEHDAVLGMEHARFYSDGITDARLEIFAEAGHLFPITRRDEVLARLRDHIDHTG